jgi:hypothetical protein
VAFESGSRLERIGDCAFYESVLKSIVIPSSVVVVGKSSFSCRGSLESVAFESGSRLERIEEAAFAWARSKAIVIPSSVVVLGPWCFRFCESLESVAFESGSRLERVGISLFSGTRVHFPAVADSLAAAKKNVRPQEGPE